MPFFIISLFLVSSDINDFNFFIFDKVGKFLFHSSLTFISLEPGLVASPPISKIPQPSLINFLACALANSFYKSTTI